MSAIIDWVKEFFDPTVIMVFMALSGYGLLMDVPKLRRKKLKRDATIFTVVYWGYIAIFAGLLAVVIFL